MGELVDLMTAQVSAANNLHTTETMPARAIDGQVRWTSFLLEMARAVEAPDVPPVDFDTSAPAIDATEQLDVTTAEGIAHTMVDIRSRGMGTISEAGVSTLTYLARLAEGNAARIAS